MCMHCCQVACACIAVQVALLLRVLLPVASLSATRGLRICTWSSPPKSGGHEPPVVQHLPAGGLLHHTQATRTHTHRRTHRRTRTYTYCSHTHTHTHPHTPTHPHTHTGASTHTHKHTHTPHTIKIQRAPWRGVNGRQRRVPRSTVWKQ